MTDENSILNFDDALNALTNASESFKIDVWLASKGRYVTFKEINAKQQKSLLSAAIDNSVYNSDFIKSFYEILNENILNEDYSIVDEFTIADKAFIAISLKSQISEELSVNFDDKVTEKVNLKNIIFGFNTYKTPTLEKIEVKNGDTTISISISMPTIKDELDYEEQFYKDYKKTDDIKTTKDIQHIVSEAFIGETSKYINEISIDGKSFDFKTLTFNQKIRIVEKLPSALIQKLLEVISEWKKSLDLFLTVTSGEHSKVISIDSLLFLS
jgi:hypothetical protein